MNVSVDVRGLEQLSGIERRLESATERALDRTARVLLDAKEREIGKTYGRKIPKGKNGKPKWQRSGDWQRGQTVESKPGQRTIKTEGNAAKYEPRLANLPNGADGVNRTNKAAENAVKATEPQLQRVFESELANQMSGLLGK